MTRLAEGNDRKQLLHYLTSLRVEMVAQVRELVACESPTNAKQACDRLASHLAAEFQSMAGRVRLHRQGRAGNHLQVDFKGAAGRLPILLLGHYDTVYDLGTLKTMPWREQNGRLYGPGVFDMKSGIMLMMFAIQAL